jgi:hypothetical protein
MSASDVNNDNGIGNGSTKTKKTGVQAAAVA